MANITPAQLFPGLTSDGTSVTIPLADLPGLTAAEAAPTTGDGRALSQALDDAVFSKITALAANAKPTKMTATKASPTAVAGTNDQVRIGYTKTYDVQLVASSVALVPEA